MKFFENKRYFFCRVLAWLSSIRFIDRVGKHIVSLSSILSPILHNTCVLIAVLTGCFKLYNVDSVPIERISIWSTKYVCIFSQFDKATCQFMNHDHNAQDFPLKVTTNLTHYVIQFSLISHNAYLCHEDMFFKCIVFETKFALFELLHMTD